MFAMTSSLLPAPANLTVYLVSNRAFRLWVIEPVSHFPKYNASFDGPSFLCILGSYERPVNRVTPLRSLHHPMPRAIACATLV